MKIEGVTTQMKALDEHSLMAVFPLLLNRVHVFANFMFNLDRNMAVKRLNFPVLFSRNTMTVK